MISVLTDPRRRAHLISTLACVDSSARDERRLIVVDGESLPEDATDYARIHGWEILFAPKPAIVALNSNKHATWAAFGAAAAGWEDLLFLEDDVDGCPNAAKYACQLTVPNDCAWVSIYAAWGDESMPWGVARFRAGTFSYNQALKIPHRTLSELHAARAEMAADRSGASDDCLRNMGDRRGWMFGVHYPGVFQHRAADDSLVSSPDSLALLTPGRTSKVWLGTTDAMNLRPRGGRDQFR